MKKNIYSFVLISSLVSSLHGTAITTIEKIINFPTDVAVTIITATTEEEELTHSLTKTCHAGSFFNMLRLSAFGTPNILARASRSCRGPHWLTHHASIITWNIPALLHAIGTAKKYEEQAFEHTWNWNNKLRNYGHHFTATALGATAGWLTRSAIVHTAQYTHKYFRKHPYQMILVPVLLVTAQRLANKKHR